MSPKPSAKNPSAIPHPYRFVFPGILNFITVLYGVWFLTLDFSGTDAGFGAFFAVIPLMAALVVASIINFFVLIRWAHGLDRRLTIASKVGLGLVAAELLYLIVFNVIWMRLQS